MRWRAALRLGACGLLLGLGFAAYSCANGQTDEGPGDGATDGVTSGDGGSGGDGTCGSPMDPNNCGTCGHMCPMGQVCSQGQCGTMCMPPAVLCDGSAPPPPPPPDAGSDGGVVDAAPPPVDSGHPAVQPYCANLSNDPANCGVCGKACAQNHTCMGSMCVLNCPPSTTACAAADECLLPGTCCTNADCADAGGICPTPGGTCGCSTMDTFGKTCMAATVVAALTVGGSNSQTGN